MMNLLDDKADTNRHAPARVLAEGTGMGKGCKTFAVELSAYFDGELEGAELEEMEAHLAACAGCRDTLQRLGKLRNALHALSRPTGRHSPSILEDLKARLSEEEGDDTPGDPLAC